MLQESSYVLDLNAKTCKLQSYSSEQATAMSTCLFRKKHQTVYCIGGYGSGGMNYKLKIGKDNDWNEFERQHTSLSLRTESEIELANNNAFYFE